MSLKPYARLALLLAATTPLSALASSRPSAPACRMDVPTRRETRAAQAWLQLRESAVHPDGAGGRSAASGARRLLVVEETGTVHDLGMLESPRRAAPVSHAVDPVLGGT